MIIISAVCLTQKIVNNKICDALCRRTHEGGYSKLEYCICYDNKGLIQDLSRGQIKLDGNNFYSPEHKPVSELRD